MTEQASRPIQALLQRADGGPRVGQPALIVADRGVGKSALLAHIGLDALLQDLRVLHVALSEGVDHVRSHYDELVAQSGASADVGLERRRMILSYAQRPFDPAHLGAQLLMLRDVAQFKADLLVVDGLDADGFLAHGEALSRLSLDLDVPAWFAISSDHAVVRSVGNARVVVRLTQDGQDVRLRLLLDGAESELPWSLDPTTHALRSTAPGEAWAPLQPGACTLYSGGASGAEAAFGEAAARHGVREVNFSFDGHKQARTEGQKVLTPSELEAGDVSLVYVSRRLHRNYNENGLIRRVLQTLWHMVSRSQQIFVVGAIQEDGTVVGGTGWSVELARMWQKDLWVFDQERDGWFRWNGKAWEPGEPRLTSTEICGTGTRYLNDNGKQAIDNLFAWSFPDA